MDDGHVGVRLALQYYVGSHGHEIFSRALDESATLLVVRHKHGGD